MYQSVLYCQILNVFELKYAEYKPLHCFRITVRMQRTNPLILSVSVSSTVPLLAPEEVARSLWSSITAGGRETLLI